MKVINLMLSIYFILLTGNLSAQQTEQINFADSTGLPGDNFSLEAALATFKKSTSLEDFERRINSKDSLVNNLDLNGDGKVDYVRVIADKKGDAHIVILQVPVSKTESQDVAVIEIEKDGEKSAFMQILGDEDLYGETKIVEPADESEPGDPGVNKKGPSAYISGGPQVYVNVWFWPCVRFIYAPVYVVYVSPWYWDYWPGWWNPWYPYSWRFYYMHNWHHHHHYHHSYHHRSTYAHNIYAPRRSRSTQVSIRYRDAQVNYRAAHPANTQGVRPGTSTRPVNQPNSKPATRPDQFQAKPGTKPAQPQTRPQTKPATRPDQFESKPGTRPPQPQTRPQTKPSTAPNQFQSKPGTKPATPKSPPQTKPTSRPPSQPQMKPQTKPQGTSKSNSGGNKK